MNQLSFQKFAFVLAALGGTAACGGGDLTPPKTPDVAAPSPAAPTAPATDTASPAAPKADAPKADAPKAEPPKGDAPPKPTNEPKTDKPAGGGDRREER